MKDWTGIEIERARQALEHASATILGRILFEFSRLDISLGLFLVWFDGGSQLEKLTKEVGGDTFHNKLDRLKKLIDDKYIGNLAAHTHYCHWLADAHFTRRLRNDLVHGRWGTDPIKNQVINVIGLPTSPDQRKESFTIADLKHALHQMEKLQARLQVLREQYPI